MVEFKVIAVDCPLQIEVEPVKDATGCVQQFKTPGTLDGASTVHPTLFQTPNSPSAYVLIVTAQSVAPAQVELPLAVSVKQSV
jgi:hypothetical protein